MSRIVNLDDNQFISLQEFGISIDCIYLLERYMEGNNVNYTDSSILSSLQKLKRKGFIDDNGITQEGISFYNKLEITDKPIRKVVKAVIPLFDGWHKEFEDELFRLTGERQIRVDIKGKKWSYLCGDRDLQKKLSEVFKAYSLEDEKKVKAILMQYINTCYKDNAYTPLFKYYIMKDGMSDMITDLESPLVIREEPKLIETENYF